MVLSMGDMTLYAANLVGRGERYSFVDSTCATIPVPAGQFMYFVKT